ncbi:hypothetical protein [Nocardia sp. NPDC024068]
MSPIGPSSALSPTSVGGRGGSIDDEQIDDEQIDDERNEKGPTWWRNA